MKKTDLWQSSFDFLGLSVLITSDSPHFHAYINFMYTAFQKKFSRNCTLNIQVFIETEQAPFIKVNGKNKYLDIKKDFMAQGVSIIWSAVAEGMKEFYIVHAAVLSYNGKGIMIIGPSGYGKTSISLSLSQKGCNLLSDAFALISRKTGKVYPFPRAVGIWKEILSWYKIEDFCFSNLTEIRGLKKGGKRLLQHKLLKEKFSRKALPVDYIFLLDSPLLEKRKKMNCLEYFDFGFFQKNQTIVKELLDIEGVHLSKKYMDGHIYVYRFGVRKLQETHTSLNRIWRENDKVIAFRKIMETFMPTKNNSPYVAEIPSENISANIVMHLKNDYGNADFENPKESFVDVAHQFDNLFKNACSYRIKNGTLDQTCKNILNTISDSHFNIRSSGYRFQRRFKGLGYV